MAITVLETSGNGVRWWSRDGVQQICPWSKSGQYCGTWCPACYISDEAVELKCSRADIFLIIGK